MARAIGADDKLPRFGADDFSEKIDNSGGFVEMSNRNNRNSNPYGA
jgi:hypothetical protein